MTWRMKKKIQFAPREWDAQNKNALLLVVTTLCLLNESILMVAETNKTFQKRIGTPIDLKMSNECTKRMTDFYTRNTAISSKSKSSFLSINYYLLFDCQNYNTWLIRKCVSAKNAPFARRRNG
jgi:hypothetical protein